MKEWLREWREGLGWSKVKAARELDVPPETLHRWEYGKIAIRHERMLELAAERLAQIHTREE